MGIVALISKILAIIGLGLDIFGVYKLFYLEPKPIHEAPEGIFDSTLTKWSNLEKLDYIAKKLNQNIGDIRHENNRLRRKARKYFLYIIVGFVFQLVSIFISF